MSRYHPLLAMAAVIAAISIVGLGALVYLASLQPGVPVVTLSTQAELMARLPPAPRGARLTRTSFTLTRGCVTRCAEVTRTYAMPDRVVTVDVLCTTIVDALNAIHASGYNAVDAESATDRDACARMIVPGTKTLMEHSDGSRRIRYIFEAYPTPRDDAIIFAAVEPTRRFADIHE